jgi:AcrR family transcriptional regulator
VPSAQTLAPAERRRLARRAQIIDVAWELARRDGLAAVSLRELADRVDMRQPSLYNYFESKAALYDAMFAQGFADLVADRERLRLDADPMTALRQGCRHFVDFCVRDPVRYQLLFQHSVPGFQPSATSMGVAGEALEFLRRWLVAAGARGEAAVDLMRALLLGIAGEQIANEPGGRRWARFTDDVVDVVMGVMARNEGKPAARTRRRRA